MVPVLLDEWENARGHYTVGFAEVLVDLCGHNQPLAVLVVERYYQPCSVRVMDCSSFSSSSVADRARGTDEGRDMLGCWVACYSA